MRKLLTVIVYIMILSGCRQTTGDENVLSSVTPAADPIRSETVGVAASADTVTVPPVSPIAKGEAGVQAELSGEESSSTLTTPVEPSATEPGPVPTVTPATQIEPELQEYLVPQGSRPHDVAPAPDGTVWYTAQRLGELGRLDPATGETYHIPLGDNSAPHGVIVGPDGAAWVTDGGLNAIVRVDADTEEVLSFPLPAGTGNANLNTATFDQNGNLWFTGQNGIYGRLDPTTGEIKLFAAPSGRGPYGIATTPDGDIYYASLAGNYVGRVDPSTGEVTILEPPTPVQGARRVWSDSGGRIWVSEWNAGQLAILDPATGEWREWPLPGERPMPYAIYVDDQDMIWLSDFGANAIVRFDPIEEEFKVFPLPSPGANVRQILGRSDEVWGAESGTDKLVVIRTG